uniref:Uncharacterized protein n=1 Tax=Rhizophora mucronata TaxID=61149 RepID=A0A2P2P8R7_RHIMU
MKEIKSLRVIERKKERSKL